MTEPTVPPEAVLRRAADVRYRIVGDEAVVIRQDEAEAIVLNEVAARILDLVDGQRTAADICERVASEFDAPASDIEQDTRRHLGELREIGILEAAG